MTKRLTPEGGREIRLGKQSNHSLLQRLVETLCYAILLRRVAQRLLPLGTVLCEDLLPLLSDVLTTLVIPEDANVDTIVGFDEGPELLVSRKSVALALEKVDPGVVLVDVMEGNPVLVACVRLDWHLAMEVRDD